MTEQMIRDAAQVLLDTLYAYDTDEGRTSKHDLNTAEMNLRRALTTKQDVQPVAVDLLPGLRMVALSSEYEVSQWGEVLCAMCRHPHSEGAWSDRDPDDGTCWNAGSLVCGCPKFITPSVRAMARQRFERNNTSAQGVDRV